MPQIQNIDRGSGHPEIRGKTVILIITRGLCVPEACVELSCFYGLISIRDSEGDVVIEVNECGG